MGYSKCVRASRIFVKRLLALLRSLPQWSSKLALTSEFKKDLQWWIQFLDVYNGVSMIPPVSWSPTDFVLSTDACLTGGGAVEHNIGQFVHFQFPDDILALDLPIHMLELLTVVAAVKQWAHSLRGQRLQLFCDNSAAVLAINSGRTKCPFVSSCLRELWFVCSTNDIEMRAVHIAGVDNRQADWLSRWHLDVKFRELFMNSINDSYLELSFDFNLLYFQHTF